MTSVAHDMSTAIRATAVIVRGMFGLHRRTFRYDARFPDGHIKRNVDVTAVLNAARYPADGFVTAAARKTCPEVGAGRWVEYASGREIDDPVDS